MRKLINQRDSQNRPHGVWELYCSGGTLQWRGRFLHGNPRGLESYWGLVTAFKKVYYLNIK
jgi:hypothetical protein